MKERIPLLGTGVDLVTREQLTDLLCQPDSRLTVGHHNLHSLALCQDDAALRAFFDSADVVFIDGMPIVWYLRARGVTASSAHRSTGLDWLPRLLNIAAARPVKLFHLGGTHLVATFAAQELPRRFPGLKMAAHHGFFDPKHGSAENKSVVDLINAAQPDLLLVGMGMPLQEHWVLENRDQLAAPAVCTIGGTLSYFAGVQSTPPRWLGGVGLEGVYRGVRHPRRLGHRYFVEPASLVRPLVLDWREHRTSAST